MITRKRCIQHPMILEDNMPIDRPNRPWRWIFSLLMIGLASLVISEIARAESIAANLVSLVTF